MKNLLRPSLISIISILSAITIGSLLMIAVYCLPVSNIRKNVFHSLDIYTIESDTYSWAPSINSAQLDNYTDALMLNVASFKGKSTVINQAMNNSYISYEDETSKSLTLARALSDDSYANATINNYSRYWHGYLIWLKPLLCFLTMSDIRIMFMCVQLVLAVYILIDIYRKSGIRITFPIGITFLSLNPISTALCMQYACIYTITLIAVLIMLKTKIVQSRSFWLLFLWIGISTAFFDFLTYPLVDLGIPLLLMIAMSDNNTKEHFRKIVFSSSAWAFGYAGMWSGKWTIASLLTGKNAFIDSIASVKFRSSGDASVVGIDSSSVAAVIKANAAKLYDKPVVIMIVLIITIVIAALISKRCIIKMPRRNLLFLLVGCYPLVWYTIIRNHSAIHAWMTFRNLAILIFAVGLFIMFSLEKGEKNTNG